MDLINLVSLIEKDSLEGLLLVKEKVVSIGKNGKPFMFVLLGNKTGHIDSRVWDKVEQVSELFEVGDIVKVKGAIQVYQSRKQLVIHRIEKYSELINMDDFVVQGKISPEVSLARLKLHVSTMENIQLKQLVNDTINDDEILPLLTNAPAAKSIHHAWKGGLLEHMVSIIEIMDFFSKHYNFLNRDLLFFGAIFHDIGKIWELSFDEQTQYTFKGRLLGHMQLACELIDKKSQRILGFSDELRVLCKHIILSHHGKLEYGSPKRPKFMEAMLVAMVDDLDSKISTLNSFVELERNSGSQWSKYNELFERYFLLEDLKENYK